MTVSNDSLSPTPRAAIVLPPEGGRVYPLGLMSETSRPMARKPAAPIRCRSGLWHRARPGVHETEDDVFYVLEGTINFILDGKETKAPAGSFVLAAAGVRHDFENRTDKPARMLNFYSGPFEKDMPMIAAWYRDNPAEPLR